ncbi:MAG: hypothetical protein AAGE01_19115, partial [Pseudomonadota bacterium]
MAIPPDRLNIRFTAPESAAPTAFARLLFGEAPKRPHDFRVPLRQLGKAPRAELWTCPGPHDFHEGDGLQIARSRDHCLVYASVAEAGTGLRNLSRELYDAMLTGERLQDYPHIVKAWNYIAEINEGEADDERYKQFCLGRGEVYDAL